MTMRSVAKMLARVVQAMALAFLSMVMCVPALAAAGPWEHDSKASAPYTAIRVLDTDHMPIESRGGATGWGSKLLFKQPEGGGALHILYTPPGGQGAYTHYHTFHEWAYNIAGDFTNNEETSPDDVAGPEQRFREGNWLDRPPYSLHGGERGRMPWMASQVGSVILIMEEADASAQSFIVDPAVRKDPSLAKGMRYTDDWKKVEHWATPRIIDTIDKMPWQPVEGVPGLNVKHLSDDPEHGFRANLWFLEGGAPTPAMFRPQYYRQAHVFDFVITGDLAVDAYSGRPSGSTGEHYQLGKNFFVDRPPMSIFGLTDGVASKGGVVWLEVTYAKGTVWTKVPTHIEAPNHF